MIGWLESAALVDILLALRGALQITWLDMGFGKYNYPSKLARPLFRLQVQVQRRQNSKKT